MDLEDFEFNIRQDERRKFFELRQKERERRRWEREARIDIFKATLKPRMLGFLLILLSLFVYVANGCGDATWLMVTVPIGALFMIMPGSNRPKPHR